MSDNKVIRITLSSLIYLHSKWCLKAQYPVDKSCTDQLPNPVNKSCTYQLPILMKKKIMYVKLLAPITLENRR